MSYDLLSLVNVFLFLGLFVSYWFGHRDGYLRGCIDTEKRLPTHEHVSKLQEELDDCQTRALERWKAERRTLK